MVIYGTYPTDFNPLTPVPSLFKKDKKGFAIPIVNPECEWVLDGKGVTTIKLCGIMTKCDIDSTGKWGLWIPSADKSTWVQIYRDQEEHKAIWEAFDGMYVKSNNYCLAYGKDIRNNPHNLDGNYMVKLYPASIDLLLQGTSNPIHRGVGITDEMLFENLYNELKESPEIAGIVFHLEASGLQVKAQAQVTKEDMGIVWPALEVSKAA